MQRRRKTAFWLAVIGWMLTASCSRADDGSRLWLRYDLLEEPLRSQYQQRIRELVIPSTNVFGAVREELLEGLGGLLGEKPAVRESVSQNGAVWIGTAQTLRTYSCPVDLSELQELGEEGFLIRSVKIDSKDVIVIAGNTERGVLYGGFCFLRLLQTGRPIDNLSIREKPRIARRLLNHWDNLDGSVERGYAGRSIWKWQDLPERIDP
ncbi:MAG TPA: alpha-glucuronidase family glycosyl hydrolase, partial [Anaerohalosphaeraceae bacterium]|nr:alpha-glucuronidase family glycosyl hydrolase [Anaerohalosphaeraceae bacterium]